MVWEKYNENYNQYATYPCKFMTTIHTLENTTTDQLLEVFNHSFSDYIVPLVLTKAQLVEKIKSDSVKLELSVGAFENNQLIAFMLHGFDIVEGLKVVYNAGTGVIPAKRGNKLTSKMYGYLLPSLHKKGIAKIQLEVITTNAAAIKTYTNLGFEIVRELNCYKESLQTAITIGDVAIRNLETYDWPKLQSFWDFKPSWQNSISAVEKLKNTNISLGIYRDNNLLGYIIYNPNLKRIHQFAIDKPERNKGFGTLLLDYIGTHYDKAISIINIEHASNMDKFINKVGLKEFIKQYEMLLSLNNNNSQSYI